MFCSPSFGWPSLDDIFLSRKRISHNVGWWQWLELARILLRETSQTTNPQSATDLDHALTLYIFKELLDCHSLKRVGDDQPSWTYTIFPCSSIRLFVYTFVCRSCSPVQLSARGANAPTNSTDSAYWTIESCLPCLSAQSTQRELCAVGNACRL